MADINSKVVPISSHNGGNMNSSGTEVDDSPLFARMPAPFIEMKDKGKQGFQPLLQALFDNIDDALFELADRAEHNAEQNMYFESMREVRIKRRGMELGFGRELDSAFRQLLAGAGEPPLLSANAADEPLSIDTLTLVADDELEELVASDGMIAKASAQFAGPLKQLTVRLDSLVLNTKVDQANNPYGPAMICHAFISVCSSLDLDIKAKLVLFKLFERYVMTELGSVYSICNNVLIEGGILPKLEQRGAKRAEPGTTAESPSQAQTPQGAGADVFSDLQNLLHNLPQQNAGASSGLVAPGQAPQIPRDTLMQLLQAVQQSAKAQMEQQQQQAMAGVSPAQIDVQQALNGLLTAKVPDKSMSIGQVDDDAINLVAMLFQFILDDRNLAAPMKAMIARLQIPIIKVAMLDKSFFSKGGHPARKLLNEIANASLGWTPGANIDRDPLYKKVSSVVTRLLNDFDGDTEIFHEVLADFVGFLEMDRRRTGLIEQRTVNAEDGKAKSELARNKVQSVLTEKVIGKSLPKVVITLLEDAWSNVLFLLYLKEGEGKNWEDALQVVDDLLWSVVPMETTKSRQRLLKIVPHLLKNLRGGLTKIGYNPFDMNALFGDLEKIHLAQLKELSKPAQAPAAAAVPVAPIQKAPIQKAPKSATPGTLDEQLEEHAAGDVSMDDLDAEFAEFDALGDLVAQSADADTPVAVTPVPEKQVAAPVEDTLTRQVVSKLVVAGTSPEPAPVIEVTLDDNDPILKKVDAMTMGLWVELHQEDEKKFRCRLAAIIRSTGKYIFVNRSGMKVAEHNRNSLALAMKQGAVTLLDEGLLFDRALESVIGNLRSMKTTG